MKNELNHPLYINTNRIRRRNPGICIDEVTGVNPLTLLFEAFTVIRRHQRLIDSQDWTAQLWKYAMVTSMPKYQQNTPSKISCLNTENTRKDSDINVIKFCVLCRNYCNVVENVRKYWLLPCFCAGNNTAWYIKNTYTMTWNHLFGIHTLLSFYLKSMFHAFV